MRTLRVARAFIGDGHPWPESYYLGSFQARRDISSVRIRLPIPLTGRARGEMLHGLRALYVLQDCQEERTYGRGDKSDKKHLVS
jgi:hypothetical protein